MYLWAKYGTQTDIRFSIIKRAVVDLAATADWTPATGDTKVSKDGGNYANSTNNPAAVAGTGSVGWKITLSATELQCAELNLQIVDSATKAVEDQFLTIYTYGNAAAKIQPDLSDIVRMGLTALPNAAAEAAGGLYTRGSGAGQITQTNNGRVDTDVKSITNGLIVAATFAANALDAVWSTAARVLTAGTNIVLAKGVGVTGFTDLDAAGVRTAVGLASANLDTQLSTIDDFLDTEIAAILAAVDTEVASILALLNSARAEPGQGAPPVNPNMATKVDYLFKSWRNKKDNNGATTNLYADDGTTVDHKQTTAESAGTVTKGEWVSGP